MITPSRASRVWSRPAVFAASIPTRKSKALGAALAIACLLGIALASAMSAEASDARAEKPYALIFGTVWGPNNHPVYGVKVKIRRAGDKKARWEVQSDHHGEFAQRVPAGRAEYVVSAEVKKPPKPKGVSNLPEGPDRTEVTVRIQNDERTDVALHLNEQQVPRK